MTEIRVDPDTLLRPPRSADARPLFELIDSSHAHLGRWLGWVDSTSRVEDTRVFIVSHGGPNPSGGEMALLIEHAGEIGGVIGRRGRGTINRAGEIGYWLVEKLQGRGIVTRSCRRLLDHAFDDLDFNGVQIRAVPENGKSRAIPERLGFTFEGVLRQSAAFGEKITDLAMYSILASEWKHSL